MIELIQKKKEEMAQKYNHTKTQLAVNADEILEKEKTETILLGNLNQFKGAFDTLNELEKTLINEAKEAPKGD